jgi:uncharacterized phiE125 gp8 family phage protein
VGLRQTTAPAGEPVTLDELRDHCRVFDTTEDDGLTLRGKAARRWAEGFTLRQFVTATWLLTLDRFPREFFVPRPRLLTVAYLKYIDGDGTLQTIDPADYRIDVYSEPGRVEPAYGTSWPTPRCVSGSVQLSFTSGYGAASAVPEDIKAATRIVAADLHKERADTVIGASVATIDMAKRILRPHRCLAAQLEYANMEAA